MHVAEGSPGAGRVALVTGASRGLGLEIATRLAHDGYRIGMMARSAEELGSAAELVTRSGGTVAAVAGDVTDPADVDRVCATVEQQLGPVTVLVNNAGFFGEFGRFVAADPDVWWRVLEINVRGPLLLCHRLLPAMLEADRGHIVNINSRAATWNDPGGSGSAYGVSKAALARFTSSLAHEVAGTGVAVFDLSPGLVRTSMTEQRPDIDELPATAFVPAAAGAGKVAALVSGRYDVLHGRFVHVRDDLDEIAERVRQDPRVRTLAVFSVGPEDPFA